MKRVKAQDVPVDKDGRYDGWPNRPRAKRGWVVWLAGWGGEYKTAPKGAR